MSSNKLTFFLLIGFFIILTISHQMKHQYTNRLNPTILQPYMFSQEITGKVNIMTQSKINTNKKGSITSQQYFIDMIKTQQQILPHKLFGKTTIYAYGGFTNKGYYAGFPGPAIVATKQRPIKVTWRNRIPGPHILPVDYNYPFLNKSAFIYQVPTVPHAHGIAVSTSSDGGPQAYWTITGMKGMHYSTEEKCPGNSAVYIYPNEQDTGNYWFHDHTFGITRLNVYAGLAGLYKIVDSKNYKQKQIVSRYGVSVKQEETKYLVVTDKSFTNDGQLYYDEKTSNQNFDSWLPQFYGNTMLVNGVLWPKMNLIQGKHRFVFLNACQGRFLNIWFENKGFKVPFELIRVDGTYYDQPIVVYQLLATISSRIQFILDLSKFSGQVILKNNASAPYPMGDLDNFNEQFTGKIMKIIINRPKDSMEKEELNQFKYSVSTNNKHQNKKNNQQKQIYPKFPPGQKVFTTLFEVENQQGEVNVAFIDGMSMMNSMECPDSTYQVGKTYDFYMINLTPDTHPIHFHLVNMQKIKQYQFDIDKYADKYFKINGGKPDRYGWSSPPISLDPEQFRTGPYQYPSEQQKIFRDAINADAGVVTVLRIKFAKNDGSLYKSFDMRGQKYVFHCHILQHQDNEMMKYFCLK